MEKLEKIFICVSIFFNIVFFFGLIINLKMTFKNDYLIEESHKILNNLQEEYYK
jgi:hypothetical protein